MWRDLKGRGHKLLLIVSLLLVAVLPVSAITTQGTTYYPNPSAWNGLRVYLSPALHSPENTGCDGYQESAGATSIALAAKTYLVSYGYEVRIGNGTYLANTTDSNAYGSDLHVPIHSNAGTSDCTSPFNSANGGTWLIYADLADQAAGNYILSAMQSYSPGTNDLICLDTQCTAVGQLHELRATNMPAAYVEAAFHTYGPDEDWLRLTSTVGNRLAVGIDNYFGNPRCPPYCPNGIAPKDPLLTPQAPTVHYVVPTGGKDFPALSEALSSLLEGPAHGAQSVFSKQTSGMVKGVTIIDGLAIVDFANFKDRIPNASTSFVRAQLLAELNSVVFGFKNVDAVLYRFDGNHESFASWLELVPVPFMRSDWTGVNNLAQPVDGN